MNQTTELLICTMEECGELVQACSKVLRIANDKNVDKKKLAAYVQKLRVEAADVQCMLNVMIEKEILDRVEVGKMSIEKRKKLRKYSNIF